MKNILKKQNGVISVFAMVAMLFFLLFIFGAYMTISKQNKSQKEGNLELVKLYSQSVDAQQIYNDKIASPDEVVPIYTYEQLEKARATSSSSYFEINGRIYRFKNGMKYEVKSNLIVPSDGTFDNVYKGEIQYSNKNSLLLQLDGENNSGTKHIDNRSSWKNLAPLNPGECYFYFGGTRKNTNQPLSWIKNGLALDGSGDYVLAEGVLSGAQNANHTMEIVFKANTNKDQYLIGNTFCNLGIKKISGVGSRLTGQFTLSQDRKSGDIYEYSGNGAIEAGKVYHVAVTFDGKKLIIYKNGKKIATNSVMYTEERKITTLNTKNVNSTGGNYKLGISTYIGKDGEPDSKSGVTIKPYIVNTSGNVKINESKSKIYENSAIEKNLIDNKATYYRTFADIKKRNKIIFSLSTLYNTNTDNGTATINNVYVGEDPEDVKKYSFSEFSKGTNSLILKSNVGKIQTWYFNNQEKLPTKETLILGSYYYSFEDLSPYTEYKIRATYSNNNGIDETIKANNIYIGRSEELATQTLGGNVYAVRVYNTVLTEDNIKANYNIDKAKFGIEE